MAAAACSTWMTKEEPPTAVPSVYFGLMPRYSATWRLGDQPGPAVKTPSTSDISMPASARALRAASAWSWRVDLWGTMPISSDSSTPTMATRPERRRRSVMPSPRPWRPSAEADGGRAVRFFALAYHRYGSLRMTGTERAARDASGGRWRRQVGASWRLREDGRGVPVPRREGRGRGQNDRGRALGGQRRRPGRWRRGPASTTRSRGGIEPRREADGAPMRGGGASAVGSSLRGRRLGGVDAVAEPGSRSGVVTSLPSAGGMREAYLLRRCPRTRPRPACRSGWRSGRGQRRRGWCRGGAPRRARRGR